MIVPLKQLLRDMGWELADATDIEPVAPTPGESITSKKASTRQSGL